MAKYKPETYDLSENALVNFVQSFLDGKLKQHLLSQDLPEDWDKEPVKVRKKKNSVLLLKNESFSAFACLL